MSRALISEQATHHSQPSADELHRWLNVVTHLDRRFGGLSAAVPQLASAVASSDSYSVSIAAFCAPDEQFDTEAFDTLSFSLWPASRRSWMLRPDYSAKFNRLLSTADGVHIHGLWEQSTFMAGRGSRNANVPYVISAHGMLESWAVNNRRVKKAIYSALIERPNVSRANCLHALTRAEAADYRRYGARRPIAVIPNGVQVPEDIDTEPFLQKFPCLRGKRIVLFLGRIHFKKGVDLLMEAWRYIAKNHADAHLVFAGPDFEGTQAAIQARAVESELQECVLFTGMLHESMKWSALATAECFVLPSYSEGFSIAVLEAMAVGLPVVLSDRCNLDEVQDRGAGWVVSTHAQALRKALEEMLENSQAANQAIGACGRRLARAVYSWPRVGAQMRELYAWIQGGPTPTTFELINEREKR